MRIVLLLLALLVLLAIGNGIAHQGTEALLSYLIGAVLFCSIHLVSISQLLDLKVQLSIREAQSRKNTTRD